MTLRLAGAVLDVDDRRVELLPHVIDRFEAYFLKIFWRISPTVFLLD
jgi:hypothetical protein